MSLSRGLETEEPYKNRNLHFKEKNRGPTWSMGFVILTDFSRTSGLLCILCAERLPNVLMMLSIRLHLVDSQLFNKYQVCFIYVWRLTDQLVKILSDIKPVLCVKRQNFEVFFVSSLCFAVPSLKHVSFLFCSWLQWRKMFLLTVAAETLFYRKNNRLENVWELQTYRFIQQVASSI